MSNDSTLSWDSLAERSAWSKQLLDSLTTAKPQFDMGFPEKFAPGYSGLSASLQLKFWAELIIAMAKFESNWKPHEIYHEPPPLGIDSVGLLQLSYEDEQNYQLEKLDRVAKSLENPLVNLRCGVKILGTLISKDRVVASSENGTHRGGARYWSVLRA
jgi:Transglycosylase SLT domain